jgi:hypothetical protein
MRRSILGFLGLILVIAAAFVPAVHSAGGASLLGTAVLTQAVDNTLTSAVALPSAATSIGGPITKLWVANATTITSSTMSIRCSPDGGTTYYPFYTYANGTNVVAATTAAATTAVMWEVPGDVSVCTHVKVLFGTAQAADEDVYIYGR